MIRKVLIILLLFLTGSCMKYGPRTTETFEPGPSAKGLFIVNEGNFMYGNASLTYYDTQSGSVENEVFIRANGINLGDVAQSITLHNGLAYIVVNNSGVIFIIDPDTFRLKGNITGLISPRYIHFINDRKAYVTDLYGENITVIDPVSFTITGSIDTPGHRSTEEMAHWNNYLFVSCWSYDNKILVIDTQSDIVIDSIEVGQQPSRIILDKNNKIWCAASGELYRIDPHTRTVEDMYTVSHDASNLYLELNAAADTLYILNRDLWRMAVDEDKFPVKPFIRNSDSRYYGLAVDPATSHIYLADAIDYVQPGKIYRFDPAGTPVDTLTAGINPGAFCFK
ncbi:MAG TPA: YncE family protein [Bacteroidales bacterium]|nr:YncE family protein [Bacteroidales bacterium]